MRKFILIILFLFISTVAYSQYAPILNVTEEDGSPSTYPYKVKFTNGSVTDNGDATTSINAGGVEVIVNCLTTDDYCFQYTDNLLKLYVNGTLQSQWPIIAVYDYLLLDDGVSFILLDDGVSKIIIK